MKRYFLSAVLGLLLFGGAFPAQAQTTTLVGTWRSGNFAYTFNGDGTYVYIGAMGTSTMQTQISESGTYSDSGQCSDRYQKARGHHEHQQTTARSWSRRSRPFPSGPATRRTARRFNSSFRTGEGRSSTGSDPQRRDTEARKSESSVL
jgi:hypothetical protein